MLKSRRAEPATSPWRNHTRLASARKSAHESVETHLAMNDLWPDRYNGKRKEDILRKLYQVCSPSLITTQPFPTVFPCKGFLPVVSQCDLESRQDCLFYLEHEDACELNG